MTASAIAGTFVKIEPVATRKVVRLHIECPIEHADKILATLGGYPDPANAHWVGIAPLNSKPDNTLKGGKLAQEAGILSSQPIFQRFADATTPDEAADFIRLRCNIESRAHLDHDADAALAFREMKREFKAWELAA